MESGSGGPELGSEEMVSHRGQRGDFIPPAIRVLQDVFPDLGNENRVYSGDLEIGFNGGNVEHRFVGHRQISQFGGFFNFVDCFP